MIERAPVHADANRLLILDGDFDHGAEVGIVLAADAHVAGIDAVLGKSAGAFGIFLEQQVSVVMEITDNGDAHALLVKLLDDGRDGGSGLFVIDRDANQLGTCPRQGCDLLDGRGNVGGVGVGHGLHHNRCIATHADAIDRTRNGFPALNVSHAEALV